MKPKYLVFGGDPPNIWDPKYKYTPCPVRLRDEVPRFAARFGIPPTPGREDESLHIQQD